MYKTMARLTYVINGQCGNHSFSKVFPKCESQQAFEKVFEHYVEVWEEMGYNVDFTFVGYTFEKVYLGDENSLAYAKYVGK